MNIITLIKLIAFALLFCGLLVLFRIPVREIFAGITKKIFRIDAAGPQSLAGKVKAANRRNSNSRITRVIRSFTEPVRHAKSALTLMGREKTFVLAAEIAILGAGGGIALALILGNLFLAPVLAGSLFFLPFGYVSFLENGYARKVAKELETALSSITNAYLQTGDIISAVRKSLPTIQKPVHQVFARFVASYEVGISPRDALGKLKGQMGNKIFDEWVEQATLCQNDQTMIPMLQPIVEELSIQNQVQADLKTKMYEPIKEFGVIAVACISIIPLMYFFNRTWFDMFAYSTSGKVLVALNTAIVMIGVYKSIRITRPIEYN
jgi:hypothetical protein